MASDPYASLRRAAAAHRAKIAGEAQVRAEPTGDEIKARSMRLVESSLLAAERASDPAMRAKHLEAAERAMRLAGAAQTGSAGAQAVNIYLDTSAADEADEPALATSEASPLTH